VQKKAKMYKAVISRMEQGKYTQRAEPKFEMLYKGTSRNHKPKENLVIQTENGERMINFRKQLSCPAVLYFAYKN
jgi:hypothetical protein